MSDRSLKEKVKGRTVCGLTTNKYDKEDIEHSFINKARERSI